MMKTIHLAGAAASRCSDDPSPSFPADDAQADPAPELLATLQTRHPQPRSWRLHIHQLAEPSCPGSIHMSRSSARTIYAPQLPSWLTTAILCDDIMRRIGNWHAGRDREGGGGDTCVQAAALPARNQLQPLYQCMVVYGQLNLPLSLFFRADYNQCRWACQPTTMSLYTQRVKALTG